MPSLAVVGFPGNNCEIETCRAAKRNGFEAEIIRWNQVDSVGAFDAYVLPGGFSFEDRGRSGVLTAHEPIFDELREEARKGKVILGICNGAQMVVESGLIPVKNNGLPFALAHNIRRDERGEVLGTGFYNAWVNLKVERADTAFTNEINETFSVPIAHGEGRFTSQDEDALAALKTGSHVAFRYCDKSGKVGEGFPVNPNGSSFATAGIVNEEGTIGAVMPHPERFFDCCDGDLVFASMRKWIENKMSPGVVKIGAADSILQKLEKFVPINGAIQIEKKLTITDNEAFSLSRTAGRICNGDVRLGKTILFEVVGNADKQAVLSSGLFLNPSKEVLVTGKKQCGKNTRVGVLQHHNDEADSLAKKLSEQLNQDFKVRVVKVWDIESEDKGVVDKILDSRLLSNCHSSSVFEMNG